MGGKVADGIHILPFRQIAVYLQPINPVKVT